MKQSGSMNKKSSNNDDDLKEFEENEYNADDIILRVNETGEYIKRFLMVHWKKKIYRVYESELAFKNNKQPIIENHYTATDYRYIGYQTVNVKHSSKSKKTSVFSGCQFVLAKHIFVVKDMLESRHWRHYIQMGANMRRASLDWSTALHIKSLYSRRRKATF